jgi:hypothetical protein
MLGQGVVRTAREEPLKVSAPSSPKTVRKSCPEAEIVLPGTFA